MSQHDVAIIHSEKTDVMIPKALVAASLKPFILSVLSRGPSYGYEIIQQVHQLTSGDVSWTTSTLYPVLHKLENEELLESFWEEMDKGPARKYYRLTARGAKRLEVEKQQWLSIHEALMVLWDPQPGLATS